MPTDLSARQRESRRPAPRRSQDPEGVRRDILKVATEEFVAKGYSGARVDEIAARTRTSKRMIYYYFKDKASLYLAVLEAAYGGIRKIEAELDLDALTPISALETLVGFTFDYHCNNPDFVRLIMVENIHNAAHVKQSPAIESLNVTAIDKVAALLARGLDERVFKSGIDPIGLHMSISALCFYYVSNKATFSTIFKIDMSSPAAHAKRRQQVIELILAAVRR